jgi:hypothetical protein
MYQITTDPSAGTRSTGDRACQTDDNGVFAHQYFFNNTCFTTDGSFYTFKNCHKPFDLTVYETFDNKFYSSNATFHLSCTPEYDNLTAWQQDGQDLQSTVAPTPSIDEIVGMARGVIGL